MFWVIQENLYNEYGYATLMESINRLNIPHAIVKVAPFFDKLLPEGFDTHSFYGDIIDVAEPEIDDSGLVMCMGSLTLAKIAKKRGWKPGSFHNNCFNWEHCELYWARNMLNFGSIYCHIKDVKKEWDSFFIRPSEDTKDFSGVVITWNEWQKFYDRSGLNPETFIVYGPVKKIYAEYRFFVVDGKIVAKSQYKMGNAVVYNAMVEPLVVDFAEEMIKTWQPARAFVIDIANTPDGYKIVEINNFNSAGFYACDVSAIIQAVENMEF